MNDFEKELKSMFEEKSNILPIAFIVAGFAFRIIEAIKKTEKNILKGNEKK